jgi:hypothetical protein
MKKLNKKIGKTTSGRIGLFRINNYKIDKKANIASVEIGCYVDATSYNSVGAALRNLNTIYNRKSHLLKDKGLERLIFVPDMAVTSYDNGSGFCSFCLQFKYDGLNEKMTEPIYDDVARHLIGMIEDSRLVVLER